MAHTADIDGIASDRARLRPASSAKPMVSSGPTGPFEPVKPHRKGPAFGDALVTGLLVVYPAFATAVVVGFALSGGGA